MTGKSQEMLYSSAGPAAAVHLELHDEQSGGAREERQQDQKVWPALQQGEKISRPDFFFRIRQPSTVTQ